MGGIALLTLGALNAVLALNVGTCTQGSAGSLYGGFLTLAFYLGGSAALLAAPPRQRRFVLLLSATIIAAWHSWFAARFAAGYWLEGISACFAMKGGYTAGDSGSGWTGASRSSPSCGSPSASCSGSA